MSCCRPDAANHSPNESALARRSSSHLDMPKYDLVVDTVAYSCWMVCDGPKNWRCFGVGLTTFTTSGGSVVHRPPRPPTLDPSPATGRKNKFTNDPKDAERLPAHTTIRRDHSMAAPIVDSSGVLKISFKRRSHQSIGYCPFG